MTHCLPRMGPAEQENRLQTAVWGWLSSTDGQLPLEEFGAMCGAVLLFCSRRPVQRSTQIWLLQITLCCYQQLPNRRAFSRFLAVSGVCGKQNLRFCKLYNIGDAAVLCKCLTSFPYGLETLSFKAEMGSKSSSFLCLQDKKVLGACASLIRNHLIPL